MCVSKGILAIGLIVLLPAACVAQFPAPNPIENPNRVDNLYNVAIQAYSSGNWSAAISSLQEFIHAAPDDPRTATVRFCLGEAHFQTKDLPAAATAYESFLDALEGSENVWEATARYRMGEVAYLSGDFDQAESALRTFCERHPRHALVGYARPYLAELAFQRNDFPEVLRIARDLENLPTTDFDGAYLAAQFNYRMAQYQNVRTICRRMAVEPALLEREASYRFALLAAEADWGQYRDSRAIRAFQRVAMSKAPDELRCRALVRAAECLADIGEVALAVDTYRSIVIEFPGQQAVDVAAERIRKLQSPCLVGSNIQPLRG